ncbi:MAG: hypothetical protein QOJ54_2097 [Aliidongia sp.]|jgi:hypothetical protein|nr:hypothetical protein [Aliidongia sp.]
MSERGRPRVYLHIGRNKAGSTSLQDFFVERRESFAEVIPMPQRQPNG